MIQPIYIFLLVALIVSVTIAMLVLPNILLISHKKKLFDMPDKRKSERYRKEAEEEILPVTVYAI